MESHKRMYVHLITSVLCYCITFSPLPHIRMVLLYIIFLGTKEIVKFSYRAEKDQDLDLEEGDVVLVFDKQKGDWWWRGMIGEREGLFPADILQGCTLVSHTTITPHSVLRCYTGSWDTFYMLIFLWQIL